MVTFYTLGLMPAISQVCCIYSITNAIVKEDRPLNLKTGPGAWCLGAFGGQESCSSGIYEQLYTLKHAVTGRAERSESCMAFITQNLRLPTEVSKSCYCIKRDYICYTHSHPTSSSPLVLQDRIWAEWAGTVVKMEDTCQSLQNKSLCKYRSPINSQRVQVTMA